MKNNNKLVTIVVLAVTVWAFVMALFAYGQEPKYRAYALDVGSAEAVTKCSNSGGPAGWVQRINTEGDFIEPPAQAFCIVPE